MLSMPALLVARAASYCARSATVPTSVSWATVCPVAHVISGIFGIFATRFPEMILDKVGCEMPVRSASSSIRGRPSKTLACGVAPERLPSRCGTGRNGTACYVLTVSMHVRLGEPWLSVYRHAMNPDPRPAAANLVSAAEIARLAGVTRAAVSNWRKRYPDFPAQAGGGRNALFALPEVNAWLDRQRKRSDVSSEVLVWQAMRGVYGDDMVRGLADVAELFTGEAAAQLDSNLQTLARALAAESSPYDAVEGLAHRITDSAGRSASDQGSTTRLVRAVRHFVGPTTGTVFDPACGIGSLLLTFHHSAEVTLIGQDVHPSAVRLAQARAKLGAGLGAKLGAGHPTVAITVGDSLRADQWPEVKADLVICDPPTNVTNWGREELLLDSRWELGVPTRAEHELAWLQHGYAHLAPGGRAVVVMPASVAYRRAGRRIRVELVRRGILTQVIALPAGMVASHAQPVHLWMLTRPATATPAASTVRMVDLTGNDPDSPLEPAPHQVVDVPLIDLLDETVDLTPAHHVAAARTDHLVEYLAVRHALAEGLAALLDLLPSLVSGSGALDGATVKLADLSRAGLVNVVDGEPVSTSDQLDPDYLRGFLHSVMNTARSSSGSGTFRIDSRGSRLPQMGIGDQRTYGAAFRALSEFERRCRELADLGEHAAKLAREGLTSGSLRPQR